MLKNMLNLILDIPIIIDENPLISQEKYARKIELAIFEKEYQEWLKEHNEEEIPDNE